MCFGKPKLFFRGCPGAIVQTPGVDQFVVFPLCLLDAGFLLYDVASVARRQMAQIGHRVYGIQHLSSHECWSDLVWMVPSPPHASLEPFSKEKLLHYVQQRILNRTSSKNLNAPLASAEWARSSYSIIGFLRHPDEFTSSSPSVVVWRLSRLLLILILHHSNTIIRAAISAQIVSRYYFPNYIINWGHSLPVPDHSTKERLKIK